MARHQNKKRPAARRLWLHLALVLFGLALLAAVFILLVDWRVATTGRTRVVDLEQLAGLAGEAPFDCVIVPGALVYPDGRPSAMLQDRLDRAVEIFKSGYTDRILVSGDHGQHEYNEVASMRDYLVKAGIPESCVFMDHAGFDTYDTLYRAKSVFEVRRALVTTQDFHLLRALYIGQQLGLDLWGVPSRYQDAYWSPWYRFREYPARVKAFFDCEILHSSPTYSGPPLPISGDGRITADG